VDWRPYPSPYIVLYRAKRDDTGPPSPPEGGLRKGSPTESTRVHQSPPESTRVHQSPPRGGFEKGFASPPRGGLAQGLPSPPASTLS